MLVCSCTRVRERRFASGCSRTTLRYPQRQPFPVLPVFYHTQFA